MSMPQLFILGGSSYQRSPSVHESLFEPLGRRPSALVRCSRIPQGRPRWRSAPGVHHGAECGNHPAGAPRTRQLPGRFSSRAYPPARWRTSSFEKKDPLLVEDLKRLTDDHLGGNPLTVRKFVRRSLRNLSTDLKRCGHPASPTTVGKLLHAENYAPKANQKRYASSRHRDRDRQFRYIAKLKRTWLAAGLPVISIDAKKKELIGNFQNRGRTWCREAEAVNTHDFRQDASARAVPYGLYILNQNRGYVRVGLSANTAEFAVDTIVSWWQTDGQRDFPQAQQLLIFADGGGSNGSRPR